MSKTWYGILLKYFALILLVLGVGNWAINHVAVGSIDVTYMVRLDKAELEEKLEISMTDNPDMVKKVYHYSGGKLTVDSADGIGVVYIDGVHMGLHIDSARYNMFGLHIGDSEHDVDDKITYGYENHILVTNSANPGASMADFYYNKKKGDCLVVIYNGYTDRVVAMTYFNNFNKVTKELGKLK